MALLNLLMAARKLCTLTVMSMISCLSNPCSSLTDTLGRGRTGVEERLETDTVPFGAECAQPSEDSPCEEGRIGNLALTRGLVGVREWMGESAEREILRI
jgi:hypothetical protein